MRHGSQNTWMFMLFISASVSSTWDFLPRCGFLRPREEGTHQKRVGNTTEREVEGTHTLREFWESQGENCTG